MDAEEEEHLLMRPLPTCITHSSASTSSSRPRTSRSRSRPLPASREAQIDELRATLATLEAGRVDSDQDGGEDASWGAAATKRRTNDQGSAPATAAVSTSATVTAPPQIGPTKLTPAEKHKATLAKKKAEKMARNAARTT
jgi:hypothetical protein